MLLAKFYCNQSTGSGEHFKWVLPYIGMAAISIM